MVDSNCEVSVLCTTYNQSIYLEQTLESILCQKVDFPYELIIHDDASIDGTDAIAREYETRYPEIVRVIIESENQYSKGADFITPLIRNHARGRYIALCEGDDFWIDDQKMQMQRDALRDHPECDMCACLGCTVTEDGRTEVSQIRPQKHDGILSVRDVILGGGQYLITAGLFFRKEMLDDLYGMDSLDYSLQIRGAVRGGIYYIDKKMAVYRRYAKGSWTINVLMKKQELEKEWEKERELLNKFDKNTGYMYHDAISERMKSYKPFEDQLSEYRKEIQVLLQTCEHPVYIWGMGRRGSSLEVYCKRNGLKIDGICDVVNTRIGEMTECENKIISTLFALRDGKTILASNRFAYEDILKTEYAGRLIDFQEYMPYG